MPLGSQSEQARHRLFDPDSDAAHSRFFSPLLAYSIELEEGFGRLRNPLGGALLWASDLAFFRDVF
jgi:hypothetical protein